MFAYLFTCMYRSGLGETADMQSHWTAETERRLIEMYRSERSHEEIARELSLPLDLIESRLAQLEGEENPFAPHQ